MTPSVAGSSWAWRCHFQGRQVSYGPRQTIHPIQINYDAPADRLLMPLRTRPGEVLAIRLTWRRVQRLLPPFQKLGTQLPLAKPHPNLLMPEARAMLEKSGRSRPLPTADFKQHFSTNPARQPLEPGPLLAAEVALHADA